MTYSSTYTVFDFETTGLVPGTDRVLEVAAIHVVQGQLFPA